MGWSALRWWAAALVANIPQRHLGPFIHPRSANTHPMRIYLDGLIALRCDIWRVAREPRGGRGRGQGGREAENNGPAFRGFGNAAET